MSTPSFQLAHLSDPHLPFDAGLPQSRPEPLTIKQRLALLSWQHGRRHISTRQPEQALRHDLASVAPDHVALTGDLVNLGLPAEYAAARRWIQALGPSDRVSVVPGNHDLTAPIAWNVGPGQWRDFMQDDARGSDEATFPYLRRRGPVALLGVCSALPTRPGSAAGRLGHRQLERLSTLLRQTRDAGLFRVVLMHHSPLLGPGGPRKALRDRGSFARLLRRQGAELVLHGHHHRGSLLFLPGPTAPVPVFGVPAALAAVPRPELAGWLLHSVQRDGRGWHLRTTARRYDPDLNRFVAWRGWSHRLGC